MTRQSTSADAIREALRPLIAELGQSEVSRRTGVPQPNISAWLAGRRPMSLDHCRSIAEACGHALEIRVVPR